MLLDQQSHGHKIAAVYLNIISSLAAEKKKKDKEWKATGVPIESVPFNKKRRNFLENIC